MDYPVIYNGAEIGRCTLEEQGLYWHLTCHCQAVSEQVERLYSGREKLGVLVPGAEGLSLQRRISKSSCRALPPENGQFSLAPGDAAGQTLRFPYSPDEPCPCPPLFCLFSVAEHFWQLRLDGAGQPVVPAT